MPRPIVRRIGVVLVILIALLILAGIGGVLWLRSAMKDSLAQLDGERRLPGLTAAVTVERDALGTPTIRAASRQDAARALGFLHAQDRFFQMDLMRRQAAGELSELFGGVALKADESLRIHRFRDGARRVVAGFPPEERAMLDAYSQGVEAGRTSLSGAPFEYSLLRVDPAPWRQRGHDPRRLRDVHRARRP